MRNSQESPSAAARCCAILTCSSDRLMPTTEPLFCARSRSSDVENLEAGPEQQLGGNVPLLGELRVVERSVAVFEISARILQVGIQKQAIDAIIDIVMMDRIATRPPEGVDLKDSA